MTKTDVCMQETGSKGKAHLKVQSELRSFTIEMTMTYPRSVCIVYNKLYIISYVHTS